MPFNCQLETVFKDQKKNKKKTKMCPQKEILRILLLVSFVNIKTLDLYTVVKSFDFNGENKSTAVYLVISDVTLNFQFTINQT